MQYVCPCASARYLQHKKFSVSNSLTLNMFCVQVQEMELKFNY